MTFRISKYTTFVVKPKKLDTFKALCENPTFKLEMNDPPNAKQYTYLRVTFNKSLDLEPIIAKMNGKKNYTINSFFKFLTNRNVSFLTFKTCILVSFSP